ncbi:chaplin family protein [Streptomyces sp. NPDC053560]|uniref:chaplin family protein n=1 Tax=Streptomyces sp. NPDC053560 TaxID=3365711 RepID=UPI0037D7F8ED
MRQTLQSIALVAATAAGLFAAAGGTAHADAGATGAAAGSPGVLAGTLAQLPVHVPVNVCGNTVNVVGLLNPAAGNTCANGKRDNAGRHGGHHQGGHQHGGHQQGGAEAHGTVGDSPGVGSGNGIQLPVDLPVNACGNTIDVVGVLNPVTGNTCSNDGPVQRPPHHRPPTEHPHQPPTDHKPPTSPEKETPPAKPQAPRPHAPSADERASGEKAPHTPAPAPAALAETGAEWLGLTTAGSAAALLSGAFLVRRARRARS